MRPAQTKQHNKTLQNSENKAKKNTKQRVNKVLQHKNTPQNIIQTKPCKTAKKHDNITQEITSKTNTTSYTNTQNNKKKTDKTQHNPIHNITSQNTTI